MTFTTLQPPPGPIDPRDLRIKLTLDRAVRNDDRREADPDTATCYWNGRLYFDQESLEFLVRYSHRSDWETPGPQSPEADSPERESPMDSSDMEAHPSPPRRRTSLHWAAGAIGDQVIAHVRIGVLDLSSPHDALMAMDAEGGDISPFAELRIADFPVTGFFAEDVGFQDGFDHATNDSGFGSGAERLLWQGRNLVMIDRLQVAPQWRGRRFGQLLLCSTLAALELDAYCYACMPGAFEVPSESPERAQADEHLRRYWQNLGFTCEIGQLLATTDDPDWAEMAQDLRESAG